MRKTNHNSYTICKRTEEIRATQNANNKSIKGQYSSNPQCSLLSCTIIRYDMFARSVIYDITKVLFQLIGFNNLIIFSIFCFASKRKVSHL